MMMSIDQRSCKQEFLFSELSNDGR